MEKDNFNRIYIVDLLRCHKKLTISQLSDLTKLSRPTIYLHLEVLEKKGFIKRDKNIKKKGAPVTIQLIENSVAKKEKKDLIKFLNIIKNNPNITQIKLRNMNLGLSHTYTTATFEGLMDKRLFLTDKGKQFLKQNEKK